MKRILIILFHLLIVVPPVFSQNTNGIVFVTKTHDFGSFPEDGDNQTCNFKFINRGKEMIAIAHVQTTCGCATANYTQQPIAPGKSGNISITYNPKGRPGKFNRSILVSFAGREEKVKLSISGMVIPGAVRKYKRFPYVMGDLQLKTTGFRFTPMRTAEEERSIQVVNSGNVPIRLVLHSSDSALSGKPEPEILSPDSIGEIKITRRADATQKQIKCVRLREEKTHPAKAGCVYIEICTEPCK